MILACYKKAILASLLIVSLILLGSYVFKSYPIPHSHKPNQISSSNLPSKKANTYVTQENYLIEKDKSVKFDLGYVHLGKKMELCLNIQNPTSSDISIRKIRSTCKCTKIHKYDKKISAGTSMPVSIAFAAPEKPTKYNSSMFLVTDNKENQMIKLQICADVGLPLQALPDKIDLGKLAPQNPINFAIHLLNRSDTPITPVCSNSSLENCIASIPAKDIMKNTKIEIPVTLIPSEIVGKHQGILTIQTNCKQQPSIAIPISYSIAAK